MSNLITMEIFFILLGMFMLYTVVHFSVLAFTKTWADRNTYEQVVTILAIVFIIALVIGSAS